ncbi:MAG: 4'-phosphopantetheinyl transferase family protein, partial [Lysobacter sp.]
MAADSSSSNGFLIDAADYDVQAQGQSMLGHACRFDPGTYRDEWFVHYAVEFPPQLTRAVAKRRGEYLAGRICAQRALQRLGMPAGQVAIGPDREPLWPAGAMASISHAGDRAVCIASTDPRVIGLGIDIERGIGPE